MNWYELNEHDDIKWIDMIWFMIWFDLMIWLIWIMIWRWYDSIINNMILIVLIMVWYDWYYDDQWYDLKPFDMICSIDIISIFTIFIG